MRKKIVIKSCRRCPYRGHRGGFGRVKRIPTCDKVDGRKTLPYTESAHGDVVIAKPTGDIPDWCPLDDDSVKAEVGCTHPRTRPSYDHVTCTTCGAIKTDSEWGIASRMWFKDVATAEFYKKHGRYPE